MNVAPEAKEESAVIARAGSSGGLVLRCSASEGILNTTIFEAYLAAMVIRVKVRSPVFPFYRHADN